MAASVRKSLPAIGFLTVLEDGQHGLFGGYLVLNTAGRPLEFHCTTPVRPNRAQEILYGPTLRPYLYGEQIGQTLLAKAKSEPLAVCTDVEPALALRDFVSLPLALILADREPAGQFPADESTSSELRLDGPHSSVPGPAASRHIEFDLGSQRLAVPMAHLQDQKLVVERLQPYAESLDLSEPFERIRQAIQEAQRGGK